MSPRRPDSVFDQPFTRQQALAAGVTDEQLESAAYRQMFHGVWAPAWLPDDRGSRLRGVRLLLPAHAVACNVTAAWLHGVDVRWADDLDVHVGFAKGRRVRKQAGLVVCQETLAPSDIVEIDGLRVTSAVRTTFDCLRWRSGAERLVVADAMTHAELTNMVELRAYFAGKRRLRNLRIGERLLDLVEPASESPMETRLRVVLLDGGLPRPEAQFEVYDRWGSFIGRLDLAYPDVLLAVEYDGAEHWLQRRADDRRRDALRAAGWEVLVFSADDVFRTPIATAAAVARARRARAA